MAIRTDFRVVDDNREVEDVCVSLNDLGDNDDEYTITLTQNGNEITVSESMAKDVIQALTKHLKVASEDER